MFPISSVIAASSPLHCASSMSPRALLMISSAPVSTDFGVCRARIERFAKDQRSKVCGVRKEVPEGGRHQHDAVFGAEPCVNAEAGNYARLISYP